jgi:DNA repair protein RadC
MSRLPLMDDDAPPAAPSGARHYHGHRDRLRARLADGGEGALADYELLELVLFAAIPRRDVKPLAKDLIARFGGVGGVVCADVRALAAVPGMSTGAAATLRAAAALAQRAARADLAERDVFTDWARLMDYCYARLAREPREQFRVLYLTRKNALLADELQGQGTVDHTPAYPREILRRALELGAAALILVHNHPSGDPRPSEADIALTREVVEAARPLKIAVHDHVIVARSGYVSLKNAGLMDGG